MKKLILTFIFAMFIGYVYGNFGNVSDMSAEFMPDTSHEYHGRGDSFHNSYDYRGRDSDSSYEYRGRDSDNSYDYQNRGNRSGENSMEYRGRSASTGRFVHRSGRR